MWVSQRSEHNAEIGMHQINRLYMWLKTKTEDARLLLRGLNVFAGRRHRQRDANRRGRESCRERDCGQVRDFVHSGTSWKSVALRRWVMHPGEGSSLKIPWASFQQLSRLNQRDSSFLDWVAYFPQWATKCKGCQMTRKEVYSSHSTLPFCNFSRSSIPPEPKRWTLWLISWRSFCELHRTFACPNLVVSSIELVVAQFFWHSSGHEN